MDEMKNDIIAIVECGQSVANMILPSNDQGNFQYHYHQATRDIPDQDGLVLEYRNANSEFEVDIHIRRKQ